MSKKKIYARGLLTTIAHDLNNMVRDPLVETEQIYNVLMHRLNRIKDNTYQKVIWQ